jgi:MFS family permease
MQNDRMSGIMFAAMGLLFAGIGAVMLVAQFINGEILFDVEGGDVPLGFEFAFVFFSFGLVFHFLGLSSLMKKKRSKVICMHLMCGTLLGAVVGFAGMFLAVSLNFADMFWYEAAFWVAAMVAAYRMAKRNPDYAHAQELEALAPSAQQIQSRPLEKVFKPPSRTGKTGLSLPVKAGLIGGGVLAILPAVFFGLASYSMGFIDDGPDPFLLGFIALAALMFGGFGFGAGYSISSKFQRGFAARQTAFSAFAERVQGKIITATSLGVEIPEAVEFSCRDLPCRLDSESRGRGENAVHYMYLRFALPGAVPLCHVFPYSAVTKRGKEDVVLGWELFDDLFIVHLEHQEPEEETELRRILDHDVQESLLRLKQWAQGGLSSDFVELRVAEAAGQLSVTFFVQGSLNDSEKLLQFYEHCIGIYDQMTRGEVQ